MDKDGAKRDADKAKAELNKEYEEYIKQIQCGLERGLSSTLAATCALEYVQMRHKLDLELMQFEKDLVAVATKLVRDGHFPTIEDAVPLAQVHLTQINNCKTTAAQRVQMVVNSRTTPIKSNVFNGINFFILPRRMNNSERTLRMMRNEMGKCYVELYNDVHTHYVISENWTMDQLLKWKAKAIEQTRAREARGAPPIFEGFQFKMVQWVEACIAAGHIVDGGEPPYEHELLQIHEQQASSFSSLSSLSSSPSSF